mgnify:CR=1 FL=1|jgi:hypothetical protein
MDEFFVEPIVYNETYFNIEGKECTDNDKCYAKTLSKKINDRESVTYSILCKMNLLVDPWGDDCSQRRVVENTFKRVNEECFRLYLKYLKTREQRFLTIAKRNQHG